MKRSLIIALIMVCSGLQLAVHAQAPTPDKSPRSTLAEPQIAPAEGYVITPWQDAEKYTDRNVVVTGKIVRTKNTASRCYLNFHKDWRTTFTITIDQRAFAGLDGLPERMFENKTIAACGWIAGESGKPALTITDPRNIMIIPDGTTPAIDFIKGHFPGARTPGEIPQRQQASATPDTIRIGTYNVLNLFDEYDDPYHVDEIMTTKPRKQLEQVAERIRQLDADVLALQEVENRFMLERFIRAFLPDMGYEHIALIEGNNHRGIDVAVVSRLPIAALTSHQNLSFRGPDGKNYRFQRDLLQARIVGPQGFEFELFSLHLKSKYGGAELSEPIRQAEATKIREIVDRILYQDPQAKFIICGDFNDFWDSRSLKIIRGAGQTELTCPMTNIPVDQQVTYNKKPHRSMIDFILFSPELRRRVVESSYRIIPGTVDNSGSDHNPVAVEFRIR